MMTPSEDGRRSWLCIAYAFPPINRSGTHRTLGFVRHLSDLGWDATVLTADPNGEPLDIDLLTQVAATTTVFRVPWVDLIRRVERLSRPFRRLRAQGGRKDLGGPCTYTSAFALRSWVSHLLKTPDSRVGWILPAVRRGLECMRRKRPDVLYSTSPYMSAHLIALALHRLTRIPWVADFRDPWVENPYRSIPHGSVALWDAFLERTVLQSAACIVCNTPTQAQRLQDRMPSTAQKCRTIPNGIDFDAFRGLEPKRNGATTDFVMVHCGQFYGSRGPAPLLSALRDVNDRRQVRAPLMQLNLIGPPQYEGKSLASLAEEMGVGTFVRVLGAVSHRESLAHMLGADALVLIGGAGRGAELQVPNKLFEYLGARKPILAAIAADNPCRQILKHSGAPAIVCDPQDATALADALVSLADPRAPNATDARLTLMPWDRRKRAEELAAIFEDLCRRRRPSRPSVWRFASANAPRSVAVYPRRSSTQTPQTLPDATDHEGERDWSGVPGRSSSADHVPTRPASHPVGS